MELENLNKASDELVFNEEVHEYRLDGKSLPSVTTIMKIMSDNEYKAIPMDILMKAAERGTAVHFAIEMLLKHGIEDIEEDYSGYLEAYKKWAELHDIELIGSEYKIYHKTLKYAGTIDMVAKIDGKLTLIDFKTTQKLHSKMVSVQLQAYEEMLKSHGLEVEQKIALQIKPDGTFVDEVYPAKQADKWRIFSSCYILYNYMQ